MAIAANIDINMGVRTAKFNKDIKQTRGGIASLRTSVKSLSGSVTGMVGKLAAVGAAFFGVRAAVTSVTDAFSDLDDLTKSARRLGIATEELQALGIAAGKLSGAELPTVVKAIEIMERQISEAASTGIGPGADALRDLGLSVQSLRAQSPDEQFKTIADAIQQIRDPTDKVRLSMDLFGRGTGKLINTLNAGGDAIDETGNTLKRFGLESTEIDVSSIEMMNDMWADFKTTLGGIVSTFATELAPVIGAVFELFTGQSREAIDIGSIVAEVVDFMAQAVAKVIDAVNLLQSAWYGLRSAVTFVIAQTVGELAKLEEGFNRFIAGFGGKRVNTGIRALTEELYRSAEQDFQRAKEEFTSAIDGTDGKAFLDSIDSFKQRAAEATRDVGIVVRDDIQQTAKEVEETVRQFEALTGAGFAERGSAAATSALASARARNLTADLVRMSKVQVNHLKSIDSSLSTIATNSEPRTLIGVP